MIAERITSNVRELEGSLIRLSALASMQQGPISADVAQEFLKDFIHEKKARTFDILDITRVVAQHYALTVEALRSRRRTSQIAFARQVAMYLSKRLLGASLVEIGKRRGTVRIIAFVGDETNIDPLGGRSIGENRNRAIAERPVACGKLPLLASFTILRIRHANKILDQRVRWKTRVRVGFAHGSRCTGVVPSLDESPLPAWSGRRRLYPVLQR